MNNPSINQDNVSRNRTYSPVVFTGDVPAAAIPLKTTKNVRSVCPVCRQHEGGLRSYFACRAWGFSKRRDFVLPWPQILLPCNFQSTTHFSINLHKSQVLTCHKSQAMTFLKTLGIINIIKIQIESSCVLKGGKKVTSLYGYLITDKT